MKPQMNNGRQNKISALPYIPNDEHSRGSEYSNVYSIVRWSPISFTLTYVHNSHSFVFFQPYQYLAVFCIKSSCHIFTCHQVNDGTDDCYPFACEKCHHSCSLIRIEERMVSMRLHIYFVRILFALTLAIQLLLSRSSFGFQRDIPETLNTEELPFARLLLNPMKCLFWKGFYGSQFLFFTSWLVSLVRKHV